jgi:hypothetical protein
MKVIRPEEGDEKGIRLPIPGAIDLDTVRA